MIASFSPLHDPRYAMNHEEYEQAARLWIERDAALAPDARMPEADLRAAIERHATTHNTCALATATDGFVRCTPLEYRYHHGAFWIFSEGGLKFRALERNPQVGLAVFDPYEGFGKLKSLQVEGTASIVDPADPEFMLAAAAQGIAAERVDKIARLLHVIKIVPTSVDYLDSSLKEHGWSTRQHLEW